jgi:hypothetical protein
VAVPVHDLAEQDGAAVAELRHELPELVPGIGHGERIGATRNCLSRENRDPFRPGQRLAVEPQFARQFDVQRDELGPVDGGRRDAREEAIGQRRIAVVEGDTEFHRQSSRPPDLRPAAAFFVLPVK